VTRRIEVALPGWLEHRLERPTVLESREDRMRYVVDLAARNIEAGSGGPFGAAVVDAGTGAVLAAGVNLVVPARNSTAHAEMVALQLAEQRVGSFDLSEAGEVELVSSVEPCVMCLGAVVWSGVAALVCGARDADARAIGFDEGPKPSDWMGALRARGIDVELGVLHRQAAAVLTDYAAAGGAIYNARRLPT
jgi:tRNA(Arg) A34 adenosine deaminase TadA